MASVISSSEAISAVQLAYQNFSVTMNSIYGTSCFLTSDLGIDFIGADPLSRAVTQLMEIKEADEIE